MKLKSMMIFMLICLVPGRSIATPPQFGQRSLYNIEMNWSSDQKRQFRLSDLAGKNVIISMMYLSCNTSCPITLQKLRKIESELKSNGKSAEFVVISFDPQTDTPDELSRFKEKHKLGANWHFLNGSQANVQKIALLLGFSYQKVEGSIEFNHSNRISLLSQDGEIRASIDRLDAENSELVTKAL